jgi:hypothetical protein
MTKKAKQRYDHTALIALNKSNPKLRWQFKTYKIDGAPYWQTLAPNKKPAFWPWKEYRVKPGQDTHFSPTVEAAERADYWQNKGVSAEEKGAVLAPIEPTFGQLAKVKTLPGGKHAVAAPVPSFDSSVDKLGRVIRALGDAIPPSADADIEEFLTMDMTERRRAQLLSTIAYIVTGKE